ncbi:MULTISPECIES: adenylosuccinate lyase family protein [unclassified Mameliella]|uniref:class-II fumarase/aspartase family protein n=1 Tax=unclassified Mameliella TaxID=2630630 RepID=UPI00273E4B2A|nr:MULTISPECIES: adenylosuccinate lyase family protein [unclassified Mameliella]
MTLASTDPGLLCGSEGYQRCAKIFGEAGTVDAYLQFEAALAEVQGRLGVIPGQAVAPIRAACDQGKLDLAKLRTGSLAVGYPIAPLVAMIADAAGPHGQWVHYGATTQDVMDTGMVLQLRQALSGILNDLDRTAHLLADLCAAHRRTPIAGRSKLQHGVPVSFGYKVAVWLDQILRARDGLSEALSRAEVLQFGGAVGSLAALQGHGMAVRRDLAAALSLREPDISWHVSRDRMVALASAVAALVAALAKMASDIAHLMSTEVGELLEPAAEGRGSSSTMPQKRNPVICEAILEAARDTRHVPTVVLEGMLQEHERGIGHGYRERTALCRAVQQLAGAVTLTNELVSGLEVNAPRMARNLDMTQGLIHAEAVMMQLSERLGRLKAHDILHRVSHRVASTGTRFEEALTAEARACLPGQADILAQQIEYAQEMIDLVLARIDTPESRPERARVAVD